MLNVVVVLSEALSDPTLVPGVGLDEDPIPFTRRLMATTTSGAMLSPQVGGGTANMEFEALTGLSLSQCQAQLTSPYPRCGARRTGSVWSRALARAIATARVAAAATPSSVTSFVAANPHVPSAITRTPAP